MTNQERIEHRNKLLAAKTAEEREQVRLQHHEQMQSRAKQQGAQRCRLSAGPGQHLTIHVDRKKEAQPEKPFSAHGRLMTG